MKTICLHFLLLLCVLVGVSSTETNKTHTSILVGNVEVSLGMSRDAVLTALRKRTNYLLTKLGESGWVVSDKQTSSAVAILNFDQYRGLWRVQKNWTPAPDYAVHGEIPPLGVSAIALAQALYKLAEQMPDEEPGRKLHSCTLSVSRRLPVGPYAWLHHPGQPDVDIREIDLTCAKETIQIYIDQPTDATQATANLLWIEKVLLYESVGNASN